MQDYVDCKVSAKVSLTAIGFHFKDLDLRKTSRVAGWTSYLINIRSDQTLLRFERPERRSTSDLIWHTGRWSRPSWRSKVTIAHRDHQSVLRIHVRCWGSFVQDIVPGRSFGVTSLSSIETNYPTGICYGPTYRRQFRSPTRSELKKPLWIPRSCERWPRGSRYVLSFESYSQPYHVSNLSSLYRRTVFELFQRDRVHCFRASHSC